MKRRIDYHGFSPRAFYAIQNLGVTVSNDRKTKAILRKYVADGLLFITRNCGIKTHNEIRTWLGLSELKRTGYRTKELKCLRTRNLPLP
jgi:hypothetical protein